MRRNVSVPGGSSFAEAYGGCEAVGFAAASLMANSNSFVPDPVSFEMSTHVGPGVSMASRATRHRGRTEDSMQEIHSDNSRGMSVMGASFTLANTILGIGLLGLPGVTASMGIGLFLFVILFTCLLAMFTAHLMVQSAQVAKEPAFVSIGEAAFGKAGAYLASGIMVCQTSCTLTAYIVLIKTMGIPLMWDAPTAVQTVLGVIGVVVVLLLPLSMLRDLSGLSFSCYFAVSVFFTVVATVMYSTTWRESVGGLSYLPDVERTLAERELRVWGILGTPLDVLGKMPPLIFAFVCHHTVLPIYADLQGAAPAKMDKVAVNAFFSALGLYITCGIAGYIAFRDLATEKSQILDCFPTHLWQFRLERTAMLIAVLFGFPCVHFGSRKAMTFLMFGPGGVFTWARHCGVTLFIVGYTTCLALVVPDLSFAFSWAGATVSPTMMYLYPAITYLAVYKKLPEDRWRQLRAAGACFILVWGVLVICICTWNNLQPKGDAAPAPSPVPAPPSESALLLQM
eukprot:CAMPEP_0206462314 /NCGR_PEP_ID=MMETSP0324_2-20121206/25913_1 /ASSEMBLY_ACC=CAM_ASM_000836 /TAXON_ID=2866 /ORGANISM="Crypthecodinium cohnii, Strain Seligo" /LENGTH=510 /DNA_ID=CAMNT_0053934463 /DNA_START=27 /DNA_END=1559 /DNA_ORIENTATION=+